MARDDSRFPPDDNGDALWNMAEAGDDLGKRREVDFSVIFPTEAAALQISAASKNADVTDDDLADFATVRHRALALVRHERNLHPCAAGV